MHPFILYGGAIYTLQMTGKEFAENLLEESGYQFDACLAGISDENFVQKPLGDTMSIREALEHQTEACIAVQKGTLGSKHDWGTYAFPDASVKQLIAIYHEERKKAVQAALEIFESDAHYVKDYLISHEFYHVGQMAAVRLALKDGWLPYSIYRF